ncbi:hypothetical protein OF83DRAFT_1179490 [Amylostereum chailletii]|nr:hypothetical protein OF83DRAFT_1179490 [Amylostereum chailletii]
MFATTTPHSLVIVISVIVTLTILTTLSSMIFIRRWRRSNERIQEIPIEPIRFANLRDVDSREGDSVTTPLSHDDATDRHRLNGIATTVPQIITVSTT